MSTLRFPRPTVFRVSRAERRKVDWTKVSADLAAWVQVPYERSEWVNQAACEDAQDAAGAP